MKTKIDIELGRYRTKDNAKTAAHKMLVRLRDERIIQYMAQAREEAEAIVANKYKRQEQKKIDKLMANQLLK